jgi:hypothetical protein
VPQLTVIAASDAPPVPKRQSPYAIELIETVNGLKENEVLRVVPDEGKSLRGLKSGMGRILSGADLKVTLWDDGAAAYIAKA